MSNPPAAITLSELCAAGTTSPSRIEFLIRLGVVVPAKTGHGRGVARIYSVENILEVALAEELTKARFTGYQLQQVAATLRAAIAHLSPARRIVERHRALLATVQHLSEIFGRGAGYDVWMKTQTTQLRRMEQAL